MNRILATILIAAFTLALAPGARAQTAARTAPPDTTPPHRALRPDIRETNPATTAQAEPAAPTAKPEAPATPDKLSITTGHVQPPLPAGLLNYTATTGYLPLKDEAGKVRANIFFVAYTVPPTPAAPLHLVGDGFTATSQPATPATPPSPALTEPATPAANPPRTSRPIIFCFNGGPGAASAWLHIGAAGPQRIALNDDGSVPPPPYRLVENPHTWLADADLVFIDPVNTGYSRAATPEIAKEFFGYQEDIQAMGEFIRLYTTRYQRWDSPKFIAGESYGTTRAAGLSEYLHDDLGMALNGVIMISTVLNFATLSPREGNDLPYPLYLPTYAAVAWYHKKLPADLQSDLPKTLAEVERFASDTYIVALAKGATLPAADRAAIVDKLARYTGLPRAYIEKSNLRIDPSRFEKMLLLEEGKVIGRFDPRLSGPTADAAGDSADYDPSLAYVLPVYTSTFNDYVRTTLHYENDLTYEVLSGRVHPWSLGAGGGAGSGYLYVANSLADAMRKNPHLKVLVANGRFDLATPYFATEYTFNHLILTDELRKNLTLTYYPGGHMMYHEKSSLEKLHADIANLIQSALPQ